MLEHVAPRSSADLVRHHRDARTVRDIGVLESHFDFPDTTYGTIRCPKNVLLCLQRLGFRAILWAMNGASYQTETTALELSLIAQHEHQS